MKPNLMLIIPEMSTGGAQRSLAKLSLEVAPHFKIFFVIFNTDAPVAYPTAGEVLSLEVYPGKGWLSKAFAFRQRIKKLKELKQRLQIDISISFLEGADYINLLSKGKEKVILSIRGSKLHDEIMKDYFFYFRSKILIPRLYKRADTIVAVNRGIAAELVDHYGIPADRLIVINNFYDCDNIRSLSMEPKESVLNTVYQFPVLITTGRLAPEKRLNYLIKVFIALKKIRTDVRFVIVGDGPERQNLLHQCQQASLRVSVGEQGSDEADIVFMGNQKNVFKYLAGASVYLLNSSSEGFPNGMIEAMICGVPVISSDCPYGPREIIAPILTEPVLNHAYSSSSGILMPLSNTEKELNYWVQSILSILENKEHKNKIVQGGLDRVKDFDREKTVAEWLKVLQR